MGEYIEQMLAREQARTDVPQEQAGDQPRLHRTYCAYRVAYDQPCTCGRGTTTTDDPRVEPLADVLMDLRVSSPWSEDPSPLTYQEASRTLARNILRALDEPVTEPRGRRAIETERLLREDLKSPASQEAWNKPFRALDEPVTGEPER